MPVACKVAIAKIVSEHEHDVRRLVVGTNATATTAKDAKPAKRICSEIRTPVQLPSARLPYFEVD